MNTLNYVRKYLIPAFGNKDKMARKRLSTFPKELDYYLKKFFDIVSGLVLLVQTE